MRALPLVLAFLPAVLCALGVERFAVDGETLRFGWLGILGIAAGVHVGLRRTLDANGPSLYGLTFLANLALFSPLQWQALLAGGPPFPRFVLQGAADAGAARDLVTVLLGAPAARIAVFPPRAVALVVGTAATLAFLAGLSWVWARRRQAGLLRRALPWAVLGLVVLAVCWVGVHQGADALHGRSVGLALWFWVAALALCAVAIGDLRRRGAAPGLLARGPAFAAGFLAMVLAHGWLVGIQGMREWESARLRARAERLHAGPSALQDFAPGDGEALEAEVKSAWLDDADGGAVGVSGFAWLPGVRRGADAVWLAVAEPDGRRRVVATAELDGLAWFVVEEHDHVFNEVLRPDAESLGPWTARAPLSRLGGPGDGETRLEAWALDTKRMRAWRLPETVVVTRGPDGPGAQVRPSEARP